jgi:hypothetical protein
MVLDSNVRPLAWLRNKIEGYCYCRGHHVRISDWRQRHEADAVTKGGATRGAGCERERDARLTGSGRTGKRDQAHVVAQHQ